MNERMFLNTLASAFKILFAQVVKLSENTVYAGVE